MHIVVSEAFNATVISILESILDYWGLWAFPVSQLEDNESIVTVT